MTQRVKDFPDSRNEAEKICFSSLFEHNNANNAFLVRNTYIHMGLLIFVKVAGAAERRRRHPLRFIIMEQHDYIYVLITSINIREFCQFGSASAFHFSEYSRNF